MNDFMFLAQFRWGVGAWGLLFSKLSSHFIVICLKLIKLSFTAEMFELPPCLDELDVWGVSTDRYSHRCATVDNSFTSGSSYTEYMTSEFKMATSNVLLTKRNVMETEHNIEDSCCVSKE